MTAANGDWTKGGNIEWRGSLDQALQEASQQGKLVFIDLFNPG